MSSHRSPIWSAAAGRRFEFRASKRVPASFVVRKGKRCPAIAVQNLCRSFLQSLRDDFVTGPGESWGKGDGRGQQFILASGAVREAVSSPGFSRFCAPTG
jgi:hypothetical protein